MMAAQSYLAASWAKQCEVNLYFKFLIKIDNESQNLLFSLALLDY